MMVFLGIFLYAAGGWIYLLLTANQLAETMTDRQMESGKMDSNGRVLFTVLGIMLVWPLFLIYKLFQNNN